MVNEKQMTMKLQIESLKESNDFLNILFENITSALFILDENVRLKSVNDSFSVLFQKREEEVLGKYCGNALGCFFTVDEKRDCGSTSFCGTCKLRENLLKTMTQEVPVTKQILARDFVIKGKREVKYFSYSTRYIHYNGEQYILVIVDDHTELEQKRRELEEKNKELAELNKLKSQFLGVAAHDLRNPMGAIHAFAEMLRDAKDNFSIEEVDEYLKIIQESSKFSLNLLNELLDISKIEMGHLDLVFEELDVVDLVNETVKINSIFARKKKIKIDVVFSVENRMLHLDKNKIEQVLHNLLSNAIKYSNSKTKIEVQLTESEKEYTISVKDEGVGIPEEELSQLFTNFGRTSAKTTANESSTGLGLAITKKIVTAHRGTISANSELGVGSVFSFTLPK